MSLDLVSTQGSYEEPTHFPPQASHETSLELHLQALQDRLRDLERLPAAEETADTQLQIARTLVGLDRGQAAWPLARTAFAFFLAREDWESAADACEVLFQADQPQSLSALGQGIWLAVTYPVDPQVAFELLRHLVEETHSDADGTAVAATTALFLADRRATGNDRDNLLFFTSQWLGDVARRQGGVDSQAEFDQWMETLELKEPDCFLPRLRRVVETLVQEDWWFDRSALQAQLPAN